MYNQVDEILSFLVKEDLCVNTNLYANNRCYYYDKELLEYTTIYDIDVSKKYKDTSSNAIAIIECGECLYFAINGYVDYSNVSDKFSNFLHSKGFTYSIYNIFCIELIPLDK